MVVETLLDNLHLLDDCLLSIALHSGIDGGIDFQTIAIEVDVIFLAPLLQFRFNSLAEVKCLSVIVVLDTVIEVDRLLRQCVVSLTIDVLMEQHVVEHHITAVKGILRVDARIIISGSLEQSHKNGTLVGGEVTGCSAEIGLGSCLDSEGVRTEINGISIHRQYLLFIEEHLNLDGSNPLLALHDEHLNTWDIAQ